jgi:hypothetical protein
MEAEKKIEETLRTPQELADAGIMSRDRQWQERKRGRLKFYQLGRKIFYSDQHIKEYLAACEQNVQAAQA